MENPSMFAATVANQLQNFINGNQMLIPLTKRLSSKMLISLKNMVKILGNVIKNQVSLGRF